jgi:hypothetical protein
LFKVTARNELILEPVPLIVMTRGGGGDQGKALRMFRDRIDTKVRVHLHVGVRMKALSWMKPRFLTWTLGEACKSTET